MRIWCIKIVSAQYLSYGCYLEPLNVSCSTGQIHPLSVSVGTNVSSQDCPRTYLEGLSNIKAIKGPHLDAICEDELSPEQSYTYHENCIGRAHCSPNATNRLETRLLNCNENMLSNYTTFVEIEYECIADTKIIMLGSDVNINKTSDTGASLYIQGNSYVKEGRNTQTDGFPLSCSICSSSNTSIIQLEVLDLRLSSDNNGCTQTITLDNGKDIIDITCNNNSHFSKVIFPTNTSCLMLTVSNSSDDGYFWLKFTNFASNGTKANDVIQVKCPAVVPSTTLDTTTTVTPPTTTATLSIPKTTTTILPSTLPMSSSTAIALYLCLGLGLPLLLLIISVILCCMWKKPSFRQCILGKNKRRSSSVHPVAATISIEGDRKSQEVAAEKPRTGIQSDGAMCITPGNEHTAESNLDSYEPHIGGIGIGMCLD